MIESKPFFVFLKVVFQNQIFNVFFIASFLIKEDRKLRFGVWNKYYSITKKSKKTSLVIPPNLNFTVFFIANFLTMQDRKLKFGVYAFSVSTRWNKKIL